MVGPVSNSLERAILTKKQLEGLLSLKQQQASILEAKAAKTRADESIKQGRSIIAFTVVTIFFVRQRKVS